MRRLPCILALTALCTGGGAVAAVAATPTRTTGTYVRAVPSAAKYDAYGLAGTWTLKLTAKRYLYEKSAGDVLSGTPQPVVSTQKGTRLAFNDRQEPEKSPCRRATYRVRRVQGGLRFTVISDKCAPRRLLLQSGVWATAK